MALSRRSFLGGLVAALAATVRRGAIETPREVLDYFREKSLKPGFDWRAVWGEEHAHAFTVAGVLEERILAEFRAGIDKALAGGTGFEAFREEMQARLSPRGWWGARQVEDPQTGRVKRVDFSVPRRLQTTFWSNMRAARSAGQWDRAQRTKAAAPYILYVRTAASDPRPEHLRWAGIILHVDDPFWASHWPPNGWGCKCSVRQISAGQRDRYLEARQGPDGIWYTDVAPPLDAKPYINRQTGERTLVPAGIDPGWHTNPGIGRAKTLGAIFRDRMEAQEPAVARAMVQRFATSPGFESFVYRAHQREEAWSALTPEERDRPEIRSRQWDDAPMPVAVLPRRVGAAAEEGRRVVTATDIAVAHTADHALAPWEWARVQRMLEVGEIRRRGRDGALQVMVRRDDGRGWWYLVLHQVGGRWQVGTLMRTRARYLEGQRRDSVLVDAGTGEVVAEGRP